MKFLILLLCVIVAVVQSAKLESKEKARDRLRKLLLNGDIDLQTFLTIDEALLIRVNNFRHNMTNGVGEDEIILAPIQIEHFDADVNLGGAINLAGPVKDIYVANLDQFIVDHLSLNFYTFHLEYAFTFPDVFARGWYDLYGKLGNLIPIFGKGNFNLEPIDVHVNGYADLTTDEDGFVHMTDFHMIVGMEDFKSNIEGLLIGDDLSELINAVIQDLVPQVINNQHQMISEMIREIAMPIANAKLNTLTLLDFLNWIMATPTGYQIEPIN